MTSVRHSRNVCAFLLLVLGLFLATSSFAAQQYPTGRGPSATVAADFNGDGKVDFAVVNRLAGTVSVFLNRGDGKFLYSTYPSGLAPVAVTAGDLSGNGKVDLIIANRDANEIVVLRGDGTGKFAAPERIASVNHPSGVVAADLTHTGVLSIAVLSESGVVTVLHPVNHKYIASEYQAGVSGSHIAAGDLRGQGLIDLITTDSKSQVANVLRNRGDGTFDLASAKPVKDEPTSVKFLSSQHGADVVVGRKVLEPAWWNDANSDLNAAISGSVAKELSTGQLALPNFDQNSIAIVQRDNKGNYATITHVPFKSPTDAQLVDIDGSGRQVLVATDYADNSIIVVGAPTTSTIGSSENPAAYGDTVTLTVTVAPTSGTGTPTGSVSLTNNGSAFGTRTLTGGSATFVLSTLTSGTFDFVASYGGDSNFAPSTSNTLVQVVNPVNSTLTLTSDNSSTNYGVTVNFTATLSAPGGGTPKGIVAFNAVNGGVTSYIGSRSVDSTGVATIAFPALSGGTNSVTATFAATPRIAASTSNVLVQTVAKVPSFSSVAASPSPAVTGTPVNLTATITANAPGINYETPQGTVSFYDGNTLLGSATLTRGIQTVTFPWTFSTTGFHYIIVKYPGDHNYIASDNSASPLALAVTAPTTTALASSLNPSSYGQSVNFTVTVTSTGGTPDKQVTLFDGATSLGTRSLDGTGNAVFTISSLATGTHNLTAQYLGSSSFGPSTSSILSQVVNGSPTTTALSTSGSPSAYGVPVTYTAVVSPSNSGVGTPNGNVSFSAVTPSGTVAMGTRGLDNTGTASLQFSSLPAGTNTVTATYAGGTQFSGSVSNSVTQLVGQTTTTIAPAITPGTYGVTPITLTATVTPVVAGGPPVAGTVTFFMNGTAFATRPVVAGVATLTSSTIPIGNQFFTATYNGSTQNAASTSSNNAEVIIVSPNGGGMIAFGTFLGLVLLSGFFRRTWGTI